MKRKPFGLVIYKGRAVYGWNHGLILPEPLLHFVVTTWNKVACRILGHDDTLWHLYDAGHYAGSQDCCHCLAPLYGCEGNHKS